MEIALIIVSIVALVAIIAAVASFRKSAAMQSNIDTAKAQSDLTAQQLAAAQATNAALTQQLDKSEQTIETLNQKLDDTNNQLSESAQTISRLNEQIRQNEIAHTKYVEENEMRFTNLANEVLKTSTNDLREQSQIQLTQILEPLKENIEAFKKTVTETYNSEARERFSLQERIRELIDLNNTISREARELSTALRGNTRVQGQWGEMILESILEKSGLVKGREFKVQVTTDENGKSLRDADGNPLRPDVVVYYPDGRCVVIDSKVSLTDYVDMVNCNDPEKAKDHGQKHVQSVRRHIAKLSKTNYSDFVGNRKTDFVMMFIPNEGAYLQAMQIDPDLWQTAYNSRVLIVSPTHLISVLRLVEQLWRNDRVQRNVEEIATEGGKMYDKFVGFIEDMRKIDTSIKAVNTAYGNAIKKLSDGRGSLVSRAEKMRSLGAKVTKTLPPELLPDSDPDPAN